jgi:hypothetical protein
LGGKNTHRFKTPSIDGTKEARERGDYEKLLEAHGLTDEDVNPVKHAQKKLERKLERIEAQRRQDEERKQRARNEQSSQTKAETRGEVAKQQDKQENGAKDSCSQTNPQAQGRNSNTPESTHQRTPVLARLPSSLDRHYQQENYREMGLIRPIPDSQALSDERPDLIGEIPGPEIGATFANGAERSDDLFPYGAGYYLKAVGVAGVTALVVAAAYAVGWLWTRKHGKFKGTGAEGQENKGDNEDQNGDDEDELEDESEDEKESQNASENERGSGNGRRSENGDNENRRRQEEKKWKRIHARHWQPETMTMACWSE